MSDPMSGISEHCKIICYLNAELFKRNMYAGKHAIHDGNNHNNYLHIHAYNYKKNGTIIYFIHVWILMESLAAMYEKINNAGDQTVPDQPI